MTAAETREEAGGAPVPLLGIVLMVLLVLGWGITWPINKIVLSQVPPLVHRGMILLVGGIGCLAMARAAGSSLRIHPAEYRGFLGMTLFNVTGFQALVAYGIYLMPAGRASIIGNSTPLFVAILAPWLLRTRLTLMEGLGVVIGVLGLLVLIVPAAETVTDSLLGSGLMTAAALAGALGGIVMRRQRWETPAMVLTGWSLLLGGLPIIIAFAALGESFDALSLTPLVWAAFLYTVVVTTIFGNWCWFRLMTIMPAQKGSFALFLVPPVGVVTSAIILGEPMTATDLLSMALVVAGMVLTVFFRPSRR